MSTSCMTIARYSNAPEEVSIFFILEVIIVKSGPSGQCYCSTIEFNSKLFEFWNEWIEFVGRCQPDKERVEICIGHDTKVDKRMGMAKERNKVCWRADESESTQGS